MIQVKSSNKRAISEYKISDHQKEENMVWMDSTHMPQVEDVFS